MVTQSKAIARLTAMALIGSLLLPPLLAPSPAFADTPAGQPAAAASTVTIDPDTVIQDDFLGVGVNVIPTALMKGQTQFGYTEAHWEMDRKRIETVKPKVARVWFQIDWMEPAKGQYTWDSPEMLAFYKYLDAFKEAGTEIELDFGWKVGSKVYDWFTLPGVSQAESAPADLDAYAASASAALNELIVGRGYDNIKYLTFYNEPNGSWDFEAPGDQKAYYAEMARKVSDRLTADGLRDNVQIWGPEESGAADWTQYMKDNADDVFDGYSLHVYGTSYDGLENVLKTRQDAVSPDPVYLTEFGWADDNASGWDAGYANTVIRAANMGVKAALMWQLDGVWSPDPFGGTNGTYTMWDSLLLGLTPRKTFYSAGLLTRYIPEHSQVVQAETGSPDLRAAAFKTADGNYAILLESKAGTPKDVTFDFGDTNVGKTFHKVAFTDDVVREGNAILPPSSGDFPAGTSFRDPGIGSGYTVAVYTTEAPQTQVRMDPLNPTVQAGDKIQLSADVIDNTGGVEWSVVGPNNGAINKNTGVYHAPQVKDETLIAVKATSAKDPSAYGIALVRVLPKSLPNTVEVPTFSLDSVIYPSAEALFLQSATPGAEIHYTTDGSEPTEASPKYEGPIILKNGTLALYKAKAFKAGLKPSGVTSALYQIGDVSNAPDGYEFCMYEGKGACAFDGKAIVAFGADGLFNYGVFENGVDCSADAFGDPNPGVPKRCFFSRDIPDEMPVVTFYNAGFEKPSTSNASWGMTNGWTFSDRAGVQHNGSVFQPEQPAPQGVQTGYLKTDGGVNGTISQSINFKPGTYQMEFKAAKRTSFGGTQSFDVIFDDQVIGSYAPQTGAYETYRTEPFDATAGRHTIKFAATSTTGDNTAFIDDVRITLPKEPAAPYVANASFESPVALNDGHLLSGLTAAWTFNAQAGVVRNGNALGSPNAPLGVQAAFLQTADGAQGEIAQTVEFPAGTYAMSLQAAKRDGGGTPAFRVMIDDRTVGSFAPGSTAFQRYDTSLFTVEAGSHTVRFALDGAGGDAEVFLDAVAVDRVEIPDQAALANGGFETPTVTSSQGVQVGGTAGWTFNSTAGMIRNGSVFGAANAPEGTQAGYLQTVNGTAGQFSQSAIFPAGQYAIAFQAAKRASFGGQQTFAVYVDDKLLGSFSPSSGDFQPYTTGGFAFAEPGRHTVKFAATTTSGDNTAFVDDIRIVPYVEPDLAFANGVFETPAVTAGSGVIVGGTNGWTFNGYSGILRNGSAFDPASAPEGGQAAFLQTNGGQGRFEQTIRLPAGTYVIQFQAARRSFGGPQTFQVLADGSPVGTFTPAAASYNAFKTEPFTVGEGDHVIVFAATTTEGDNTAFIDDVKIAPYVPPVAPAVANAGFETPTVTVSYGVQVGGTYGWTFNKWSGIVRNASILAQADAPEGVQAGYVQTIGGQGAGQFSQSIEFPAGTYVIRFQSARRDFGGQQIVQVSVDGRTVGTFTPSSLDYEPFATDAFAVTAGHHTVAFAAATTTGDNTAFIDGIAFEPAD